MHGVVVCPAVGYEADTAESLNDEAEDFYAIFGVVSDELTMGFNSLKSFTPAGLLLIRRGGWMR